MMESARRLTPPDVEKLRLAATSLYVETVDPKFYRGEIISLLQPVPTEGEAWESPRQRFKITARGREVWAILNEGEK